MQNDIFHNAGYSIANRHRQYEIILIIYYNNINITLKLSILNISISGHRVPAVGFLVVSFIK